MRLSFKPNKKGWIAITLMILTLGIIAYRNRQGLKHYAMQSINYLKERTWDWRTDAKIKTLHPLIRAKAKEFIIRCEKELGIKLRISSGYRSFEQQQKLYDKGRTESGNIITNAKPGQSYHNYGLAMDVVEIKDGSAIWNNPRWDEIAALGKELGFSWGGDFKSFKDKPHFEYSYGRSITALKSLYKTGELTDGYVNLSA